MNKELGQFLEANEQEDVWFAIPGGLISGKLDTLEEETEVFGLIDAVYFTGNVRIKLGDIAVLASQVSAWGMDEPTLIRID